MARAAGPAREWIFVGPYTRGSSEGIYRVAFEPATGILHEPVLAAKTTSPSFLEWHPSKRFLFAVNEVAEFKGEKGGSVTAFAVDKRSGTLTELNAVSTKGPGPCHLKCSPDGKALVVVNYSGGNTASFTISRDGRLSEAASVIQHEGSGPNQQRQKEPHAHGVALRKHKGKWLCYVADLGIDKVLAFELDTVRAKLRPWDAQPAISLAPGSGPRHLTVHPSAPLGFVINELSSTLTSFRIDPGTAIWTEVATESTLPSGFTGKSTTAELAVHPNGRFVYGSDRGHDSLAVFAIELRTGKLAPKGHVSTEGKTPRSFAIHPSGRALIAANQETGNLGSFTLDRSTGMPKPTGHQAKVDMPVCVMFS
ncbi:MAG: lactonase family protein [Bryobacterales bacterium]|nr:lactonase family protein [Bryobacterales bacterium]